MASRPTTEAQLSEAKKKKNHKHLGCITKEPTQPK